MIAHTWEKGKQYNVPKDALLQQREDTTMPELTQVIIVERSE